VKHSYTYLGLAALGAVMSPLSAWSCATCGCTVNSDAAMGYSSATGFRLNLEYTYINQDQLRGGTSNATPSEVVNNPSNPSLGGGEIERQTINHYLTLGASYRPNADWNFNLLVPYVVRDHTTYGNQNEPYTPSESAADQISGAHVSNLGDVKLIANFQGILPTHNLGVQLGVKLPTGQYGSAVNFYDGPNAGTPLDTSLQAGTGSTDVIVGAYYFQPISLNFAAFGNVQFQSAVAHKLNTPGNDYRPGNIITVSLGLRYEENPHWIPQLQLNISRKLKLTDTAGTVAYLSPGLTAQIVSKLHAYTVLQVPVYSNLSGYQLFPHWTGTVGLSYAF
jgi:hypothetical protein